jgi:predicted lipoprotein with Yx(FWY)xxD motif
MTRKLAAMAVVALALTCTAIATGAPAHSASGPTTIKLRHTGKGLILTNGRGFTLYSFARDTRNRDRCVSIKGCLSTWPIARTTGRPAAGPGVRQSLLGSIRVGNVSQVTYAGHPLYGYIGDSSAGNTAYVGISMYGGAWDALRATAALVK